MKPFIKCECDSPNCWVATISRIVIAIAVLWICYVVVPGVWK